MTASFGNCERSLIKLSVIPSLRYSVLGSLLEFTNGITAMDEISLLLACPRIQKKIVPAITKTAATPAAMISGVRFLPLGGAGTTA